MEPVMSNIVCAQSLEAVLDVLSPEPLSSGSECYVNLLPARSGKQLAELRKHLEICQRQSAGIAGISGQTGTGTSAYEKRQELAGRHSEGARGKKAGK